LIAGGKRHGV